MSTPVEAQSLSRLNYLLGNPPQYPRNPTHEAHRPLVLYIVRVPGSKDVFLTPLKPPTKASISLEAIQTSLYYLHVHGPEDEEVRQSVEQRRRASTEVENTKGAVHRKPLPPTPHTNYPASQRPVAPPKSYPSYQPGLDGETDASQLERYLARGSNVAFGSADDSRGGAISRKPVGPRKFPSLADSQSSAFHNHESSSIHSCASQHDPSPNLSGSSGRPISDGSAQYDTMHEPGSGEALHELSGNTGHYEQPPEKPPRPPVLADGVRQYPSITLIRRDPTSGVQWNIGTISDGGKLSESNLRSVSIQLDAPGYTKFADQHGLVRPSDPLDAESVKRAIANTEGKSMIQASSIGDTFVRTVEFRPQETQARQFRLQGRTNSMDAIPNFPIQNKPPRGVFSFFSPWHGLCSFSNGIDGRSLRCRHSLPSQALDEDNIPANIAELRFNLAWSALNPRDSNRMNAGDSEADTLPISRLLKEPRGGKEALRRGITHVKALSKDLKERRSKERGILPDSGDLNSRPPLPPRPQSSFNAEEENNLERLSLRLGREKAGGGYKGNSAKLGKLIIEDEGLKMGDLVVAACMGVWWQHYADKGH